MDSIVRIVTPALSGILASLDDLKLDLDISGTASDDKLNSLLARVSADFATQCDRVFGRQTIEETYRREHWRQCGGHVDALVLSGFPVSSITSIAEDGTALDPSSYEFDPATGIIYRLAGGYRSSWRASKIVATYVAGYLLPGETGMDLPMDIQGAVLSLAKTGWFSLKRDPQVRQVMVQDVGSESYWIGNPNGTDAYPPEIHRVIDRYRDNRL